MPRKLKPHAASFKFKVVLEYLSTNNVAETARKCSLIANQPSTWRGYFLKHGPSLFCTDVTKREQELEKQIAAQERPLGKKELEIQLLKTYLYFYAPRIGNSLSTRERW